MLVQCGSWSVGICPGDCRQHGRFPGVVPFATIGLLGYADVLADAFNEIDDKQTHFWTVGFRLSQFVGNRTARGRHMAARASRHQAREALANIEQIVRLDVRLAVNEVERARKQIAASTATRALRAEAFQAEEDRFEVGSSTTLLVAQAQRDLLASQIAEVEAIINYRIALVRLYLAEGSLLDRRGVHVPAPDSRTAARPR